MSALRRLLPLAASMLFGCSYGAAPDRRVDYVVLFSGRDAALDAVQTRLVDRAAAAAYAAPDLDVTIAGFADAAVSPGADQVLSRLRAQAVAERLVQDGIARRRVRLEYRQAIGGDPTEESRRVELRLGS